MSALETWRAMVEAEHAQSERVRGIQEQGPSDFWQPFAEQFRADPRRVDDPLVERLSREVAPQDTVLDVGAGAGRLALPLAMRCREVMAVEPSAAMASGLREQAQAYPMASRT